MEHRRRDEIADDHDKHQLGAVFFGNSHGGWQNALGEGHSRPDGEIHRSTRAGWLRAAVLGADDAIVSISSLMIGIAASSAPRASILLAGVAGLVAGAMSMAAGEYVSVSSQRDSQLADIEIEKRELVREPRAELDELAAIYRRRGLDRELALKVAQQLSRRDRLAAHLRDELGIDPKALARPMQAAWISAVSFGSFALVPIAGLVLARGPSVFPEKAPRVSCRPDAIRCRTRRGRRSFGPRMAPE